MPTTILDSFETPLGTVETYREDPTKIINPQHNFPCIDILSLPMIIIPNFDNCFKLALNYGRECALKYSRYKMQPILYNDAITNAPGLSMAPFLSESDCLTETFPSFSSPSLGLNLPSASSFVPIEPIIMSTPLEIVNDITKYLSPVLFAPNQPEIKSSILPTQSTFPIDKYSQPSYSDLDLGRSIEFSKAHFISNNFIPPVSTLPITNITNNEFLGTPRSSLSMPLSVSSTITSSKPQFNSLPLTSSSSLPSTGQGPAISNLFTGFNQDSYLSPSINTDSIASLVYPASVVANYLPLPETIALPAMSDSVLVSNDFDPSISDNKSFKRSTYKTGEPESEIQLALELSPLDIKETVEEQFAKDFNFNNTETKPIEQLQELISRLEILINDDKCDWNALNDILSILTDKK